MYEGPNRLSLFTVNVGGLKRPSAPSLDQSELVFCVVDVRNALQSGH